MSTLQKVAGVVKQLLSEQDNTWCPVRVFGVGFALVAGNVYLGLAVWAVVCLKQPFDFSGFGTGLASIWGVVSVAIGGKSWIESTGKKDG